MTRSDETPRQTPGPTGRMSKETIAIWVFVSLEAIGIAYFISTY